MLTIYLRLKAPTISFSGGDVSYPGGCRGPDFSDKFPLSQGRGGGGTYWRGGNYCGRLAGSWGGVVSKWLRPIWALDKLAEGGMLGIVVRKLSCREFSVLSLEGRGEVSFVVFFPVYLEDEMLLGRHLSWQVLMTLGNALGKR